MWNPTSKIFLCMLQGFMKAVGIQQASIENSENAAFHLFCISVICKLPALKRLQQGQMKLRSKWKIRESLLHFPGCLGTVRTCLNLAWWQTFCDLMFCAQMQKSMSSDSAKTAGQKRLRAEESARDKSMKIVCMKIQPIVPSECCRCFLKVSQLRSRLRFRCQP